MLSGALTAQTAVSNAQGFLVGARPGCDSFCVGGVQIQVERFDPSGLGHAFCGARPAVIILHGSDGLAQYGASYREAAAGLAKAGYSAFIVHYFGVTPDVAARGWVAPNQIMGPNFLAWESVVSASVSWVACQPGIDARRIGLMGFSLGSFLAIAEAARNPQVAVVVEFFGGIPAQAQKYIRRMPPTLIVHGQADRTVPVTEAYRLRDFLASRGIPHDMVVYPGIGHEISPTVKEDAAQRVLQFLRCHL